MIDRNLKRGGLLVALAGALSGVSVLAQTVPVPQASPRTIPGLTIGAPSPGATQTPVPVPTDAVRGLALPTPAAAPRVVATPRPLAKRVPGPRVTAAEPEGSTPAIAVPEPPRAVPTPARTPQPSPSRVHPAPIVPASPAASRPAEPTASPWPWIAVTALAILGVAGWLAVRRSRSGRAEDEPVVVGERVAATMPQVVRSPETRPVAPATPHARIGIALQPSRAGLNMLSAVVDANVILVNVGDAAATDIRVHPTLLSAHTGQEADLADVFAAPAGRPATTPFTLAPGEERRVRVLAALPREAIRSMEAAGRPMFVPLLAVDVRYAANPATRSAQSAQAFVIGIERVDSVKLAPFWLDGPLRMHDHIASRAQGTPVEILHD